MSRKTKFWCNHCRQDKPIELKSPHKTKPPYVCTACAVSIGAVKVSSFKKRADSSREQYTTGHAGKFFDKAF